MTDTTNAIKADPFTFQRYADFETLGRFWRNDAWRAINIFTGEVINVDKIESPTLNAPDPKVIGLTLKQLDDWRDRDDWRNGLVIVWSDQYHYDADEDMIASGNTKYVTDYLDQAGIVWHPADHGSDYYITVDPTSIVGPHCDMSRGLGGRSSANGRSYHLDADPDRGLRELDLTIGPLTPEMWADYDVETVDPLADIITQCHEWAGYVRDQYPVLDEDDYSQKQYDYAIECVDDEMRKYRTLNLDVKAVYHELGNVTHPGGACQEGCEHYCGVTDWVIKETDLFFAVLHVARLRRQTARLQTETDRLPGQD